MASQDAHELAANYPNEAWRKRFARICDLIEILTDCTIRDNYTISDSLNDAIYLTSAGKSMRDRLIRKEKVDAKEARLMCFLTLGHAELYVDVDACDPDQLAAAIDSELSQGKIRFPFIFGRDLYDQYAELFEDEKESLTPDETSRLLDGLPAGVFQYGPYTVGPFGLREAPTGRSINAVRRVPAYHCGRAFCRAIHSVLLETSHAAAINRDAEKLQTILRETAETASEWWEFVASVNGVADAAFRDRKSAVIIPLIGDCLSLRELRLLLVALLDETRGEFRHAIAPVLSVSSATDAADGLDRAQILQLMMFASEEQLRTGLDRLVGRREIEVPTGEVRKPVVNQGMRSGAFRLQAELGHYGVRFASVDRGLALLRQRRLFDKLYVREADADVAELEWQLRGVDVEDLDERLDSFFWKKDPRRALERLVLVRRTNVVTACEEVGIDQIDGLTDDQLVDMILWKLGFDITSEGDPHADFWKRHEQLWALTQSSNMGGSDRFLESASPYFADLEGLLLDSLAFTAWALLTDHTTSDSAFSYDDEEDRYAGLSMMEAIASSPVGTSAYNRGKVDLGNLIGGFSALSGHLQDCSAARDKYARPISEFPEYADKTEIKAFALRSTLPFLDLTSPSQTRIIEGLREITRLMTSASVNLVRNEYAHYRRNPPDVARVEAALEATRQAVTRIETLGFCRLLFTPVRVLRDPWGRSSHEFRGPRSYEHAFSRPSRFDWMGLPSLDQPAYLIRSASVGEPTEVLRFIRRHASDFSSMWTGVPSRRRQPRSVGPEQPGAHAGEASTTTAT